MAKQKINVEGSWDALSKKIDSNFDEVYDAIESGEPGQGTDGKSAYQIAVDNGFVGSAAEWLLSLKGESADTVLITNGESVNLIDPAKTVTTKAVNKNGEVYNILDIPAGLGFILSGQISTTPGEELTFSGFREYKQFQCQGSNGVQLTSTPGFTAYSNGVDPFFYTVPPECFFIQGNLKLDTDSDIFPQFQIQRGRVTAPVFTPFSDNVTQIQEGGTLQADRLSFSAKKWVSTAGGPVLMDVATTDQLGGAFEPIPDNFMKILAVGTSITNDVGASDINNGWRTVLANLLTNVLGRGISVINGGSSGQDSTGMNNGIQSLLNLHDPDITLIEVAINDARNDVAMPLATTRQNLEEMVDKARSSGSVPIIWGCFPLAQTEWGSLEIRRNIIAIGKMVAKQKSVRFVDLELAMANNLLLLQDGIHPNNEGHALHASLLSTAILA